VEAPKAAGSAPTAGAGIPLAITPVDDSPTPTPVITGIKTKTPPDGVSLDQPRCAVVIIAAASELTAIRAAHGRAVAAAPACQVVIVCSGTPSHVATVQQLGVEVVDAGAVVAPGMLRQLGKARIGGDLIRFEVVQGGAEPDRKAPWTEQLTAAGVPRPPG